MSTSACVNEIVRGERAISSEAALRLSRHFNTTVEFWLNLQVTYDFRNAQLEHAKVIASNVPRLAGKKLPL